MSLLEQGLLLMAAVVVLTAVSIAQYVGAKVDSLRRHLSDEMQALKDTVRRQSEKEMEEARINTVTMCSAIGHLIEAVEKAKPRG